MASPWNLLARLMPKRWKEPQGGLADDVKSREATSPEPVEVTTDKTPNSGDRSVQGEPQSADQFDTIMTGPVHSAEAGSSAQRRVDLESPMLVDAAGAALSDDAHFTATPTYDALTSSSSRKRPSAKQKRRQASNAIKSVEVVPHLPTSVPTFSGEAQSLDEEIKLLRDQLARKLQRQNAQLKRMLERFER